MYQAMEVGTGIEWYKLVQSELAKVLLTLLFELFCTSETDGSLQFCSNAFRS